MTVDISSARSKAPDHVPPELVYDFAFERLPGVEDDSIRVAVEAMRGMPDIFYTVGAPRIDVDGYWIVSRHDLMREIFQDPATFSSYKLANMSALVGETWKLLPLEEDPPVHSIWRVLLNPIFSPRKMQVLEEQIGDLAVDLVEGLKPKGSCEFVTEFADVFPIQIFLRMFGLPLEKTELFVKWSRMMGHGITLDEQKEGARAAVDYLRKMIEERRKAPTDDLISYVVTAEVEGGRRPTDDEAIGFCFLLYVAGLDTVASMLSFIFKHLAEHPADQQRLRDNPDRIPDAVEEFLRAYPIVVTARQLTRDTEFHGLTMKKGDMIRMPTMGAGRDDREFANPNVVDFGREHVSHITFGAGPHRCVGSHLARRELRIALLEWLKRIPPFRIAPDKPPVTDAHGVFGVRSLPLSW